jgi:O-antigen/teichoic acid export membrane protein
MLRRVVLLFGTQVVFGAMLVANSFIVARYLGPKGRGDLALLIAVPMLLTVVVSLGFQLGVAHGLSRREVEPESVFATTLLMAFAVSGITLLSAAAFFGPLRRGVFAGLPTLPTAISLASLPFLVTLLYFEGAWVALDRMGVSSAIRLTQSSVYLVMGFLLVGPLRAGVTGGIAAFTGAALAATLLLLLCLIRLSAGRWRLSPSFLGRGLRFGLTNHVAGVADYVFCRADVFLVGYLAGGSALGYYSFASPLTELIWWVSMSVKPVLFSRTAQLTGEEANELTSVMVRVTVYFACAMAIPIYVGSALVVRLWLPTFQPAVPVVGVLLVATTAGVVYQLLLADLSSRGQGALVSRIALAVLPVGLAAYAVLIPLAGIMGAALATLFAYATKSVVALLAYRRVTGADLASVILPRVSDFRLARSAVSELRSRLQVTG